MNHCRFGLIVLLAFFAVDSIAVTGDTPPWKQHFSRRAVSIDGYRAQIFLPDGWTVDSDERVLLPGAANDSGCQVRFAIDPDRRFIEALGAGIKNDKERAQGEIHSILSRVGGNEAVWVSYVDRSGNRISKLYVDLSGTENGDVLAWQFVGPDTPAGRGCETTFKAIAGETGFTRVTNEK